MPEVLAELVAANQDKMNALHKELEVDYTTCYLFAEKPEGTHKILRDLWALRFLQGFKYDVKLASEKFRSMLQFRKKYGSDEIRKKLEQGMKPQSFEGYDQVHAVMKITFYLCSGEAKDGSPINVDCTAKINFPALFELPPETYDTFITFAFEYQTFNLDQIALQTGSFAQYLKVMDLRGTSMEHIKHVRRYMNDRKQRIVRMGGDILECYPEMLGKIAVVHAPSFFSLIYKFVKPFLPTRTAEKVVVQAGEKKTTEALLNLVDEKVLPTFLGGSYEGEWRMLPISAEDKVLP